MKLTVALVEYIAGIGRWTSRIPEFEAIPRVWAVRLRRRIVLYRLWLQRRKELASVPLVLGDQTLGKELVVIASVRGGDWISRRMDVAKVKELLKSRLVVARGPRAHLVVWEEKETRDGLKYVRLTYWAHDCGFAWTSRSISPLMPFKRQCPRCTL